MQQDKQQKPHSHNSWVRHEAKWFATIPNEFVGPLEKKPLNLMLHLKCIKEQISCHPVF